MEHKRAVNQRVLSDDEEEMPDAPCLIDIDFLLHCNSEPGKAGSAANRPDSGECLVDIDALLSGFGAGAAGQEGKAEANALSRKNSGKRQYVKTRRSEAVKQANIKPAKFTTTASIMEAYKAMLDCCNSSGTINFKAVSNARLAYWELDQTGRSQWLLDYLRNCMQRVNGKVETVLALDGVVLCLTCWLAVRKISRSSFFEWKGRAADGQLFVENGNKQKDRMSPKRVQALSWLKQYIASMGDQMPDRNEILLPPGDKKDIFKEYRSEVDKVATASYFYRLLKREYPHVKVPRQGRFTKCDDCVSLLQRLLEAPTSSERKDIKAERSAHLGQQSAERQHYYSNRLQSKQNPDQCISMILDGMDQDKTNCPHILNKPKILDGMELYAVNVVGVIVHGVGNYVYHYSRRFAHDSSLVASIIVNVLERVKNHKGRLPRKLFLQLDNCVRENKNKNVLGLLAVLIKAGWLDEIEAGFLMVGHTHEDIDALFSLLARYLKTHAAVLPKDMADAWAGACKSSPPTVVELTEVADVKRWLRPVLPKDLVGVAGFHDKQTGRMRSPHQFRLYKRADGAVMLQTKEWSTDPDWLPAEGVVLLEQMPEEKPRAVPLRTIKTDSLLKELGALHSKKLLTKEQMDAWRLICTEEEKRNNGLCDRCKELTAVITANGKRSKDSAEEAKAKAAKVRAAQKQLDEHLAEADHSAVLHWPVELPEVKDADVDMLPAANDEDGEPENKAAEAKQDSKEQASESSSDSSDSSDDSNSDADSDGEQSDLEMGDAEAKEISPAPVPMVYRGPRQSREQDSEPLKKGDLAAFLADKPEKCNPPFWIARVLAITDTTLRVAWMNAPTVFSEFFRTNEETDLPRNTTVLLYGFTFKGKKKLRMETLKMLAKDSRISKYWTLPDNRKRKVSGASAAKKPNKRRRKASEE